MIRKAKKADASHLQRLRLLKDKKTFRSDFYGCLYDACSLRPARPRAAIAALPMILYAFL